MTLHPGNLAGRTPMGLKGEKQPKIKRRAPSKRPDGKDPAYLAAVRSLPCVICEGWGYRQVSRTEAHHTICGRYSQRKTPDRQAIPLCRAHHTGTEGIHTHREWWVNRFGADVEFIARTQDAVERKKRD